METYGVTQTLAPTLSPADRDTLLRVAADSINHGLHYGAPTTIFLLEFAPTLRDDRATFVTLEIEHQLRGCIGTLSAVRPLVEDVAKNAFGAAFHDPRFPPVTAAEAPRLSIHLSILSPASPMTFNSEADLLIQLRPGVDGLILEVKKQVPAGAVAAHSFPRSGKHCPTPRRSCSI